MEKLLNQYYPTHGGVRKERKRCSWAITETLVAYHDDVYGDIKTADSAIYEQICLALLGAGRVVPSVIEKRGALREAFAGYDINRCACLSDKSIERGARALGISRAKAFAVRDNARPALEVIREFGSLFRFFYQYDQPERLMFALKRFGFTHMGIATTTGLMKSLGIIQAHDRTCYKRISGTEER